MTRGAKRPGAKRPGAKRLGGELDLGRNDPDSLYPMLPTIFLAIFARVTSMRCVFLYKNVQQKFERIMFGSIYYAGLSILFHSSGLTL